MKRLLLPMLLVFSLPFVMADSCSTNAAPASSSAAAPDKSSPSTAAAAKLLLDLSGSGTKSSQTFAAKGNWDLKWTYDCTTFGVQGNFIAEIYNASDNSLNFDNQPVNQFGTKDSGVEHYHSGGTFYLKIISECKWQVQAIG